MSEKDKSKTDKITKDDLASDSAPAEELSTDGGEPVEKEEKPAPKLKVAPARDKDNPAPRRGPAPAAPSKVEEAPAPVEAPAVKTPLERKTPTPPKETSQEMAARFINAGKNKAAGTKPKVDPHRAKLEAHLQSLKDIASGTYDAAAVKQVMDVALNFEKDFLS